MVWLMCQCVVVVLMVWLICQCVTVVLMVWLMSMCCSRVDDVVDVNVFSHVDGVGDMSM